MRIKTTVLVLLSVLAVAGAEEAGESWARLYRRMPDIRQRHAIMQNIVPLDDRSLEPFLASSLNELVYGAYSRYRTDKSTYDDWEILTRTIIRELGDIKGQSASAAIWDVVKTAEVPLLKAEGLIALGMIRSTEYAPEIAVMLRNLNFNTRPDRESAEIEAYGAVLSLEKLRSPVGFEPLFYAAAGWYQDRVTSAAETAMMALSEDVTAELAGILRSATDYSLKRKALSLGLGSDAPPAGKTGLAVEGLKEGLKYAESDFTRRRELVNLRTDAINALIALGLSTDDSAEYLNKAADEGDLDEKLIAIQALGIDGGDAATSHLAGRLSRFNERQASGIALNREELTLVRQIIFALGEARNPLGLQALQEMDFVGYTPALLRLADEAREKIGNS